MCTVATHIFRANPINVDKIQDFLQPALRPGPPSPDGDEYPPGEVQERQELQRLQRIPPLQRSHHHRGRHPRQDPKTRRPSGRPDGGARPQGHRLP